MLEIDKMPMEFQYRESPSIKMKKARTVKNIQDYGSKKYERQYKSGKQKMKPGTASYTIGPAGGHQIVESITFGPGGANQM